MSKTNVIDTWYIPEGETHHIQLPDLGDHGCILVDDRGDLIVPVFVQEADHDGLLLLKQFGAGPALIEAVKAAERYGDIDPSSVVWKVERKETGGYEVDSTGEPDAADMM